MTPAQIADVNARAGGPSSWTESAISDLLASPSAVLSAAPHTFAFGRIMVDEAELLLIATDPDHQRAGLARARLTEFETEAKSRGAVSVFLEVAASNGGAIALYASAGYREIGQRKAYYSATGDTAILMMHKI